MIPGSEIELTFVMPCLNEAETLAACIRAAKVGAESAHVRGYEIVVADNGSQDGSQALAEAEGARVIEVPVRGYGAALRAGIDTARGKYVIMGDSDLSYDFARIEDFVEGLRNGTTIVMGTRLGGDIQPDAMPPLHRYLGNPVLTFIANLFFGTHLSDYHCGLRAFDREAILALKLQSEGMEFASEMLIRATLAGYSISEVPITYYPDGRSRPPHLRTWRDGWRHLRFLLLFSPRWLFLYPGIILSVIGGISSLLLLTGSRTIGAVTFDVHTLLITSTMMVAGVQLILFAIFTRAFASRTGLLPSSPSLDRWLENFSLGYGLTIGFGLIVAGIALYFAGFTFWAQQSFGSLSDIQVTLRLVIAGTTLILLGVQLFFVSFVLSLLTLR